MNARISLQSVVTRSPRIASRVLDGQAVIVVSDAQKLFTLNGVGTDVFQLADGRTVEAIVDAVLAKYDADEKVVRPDVVSFVETLVDAGALLVS